MARLRGFRTYISLCGYREIKNSSGIEDSSWTLATEKTNLPCTLVGLCFTYQGWECLPSVAICSPGATDNMMLLPQGCSNQLFAQPRKKERGQEQIIAEVLSIKYLVLFLQQFISYPDTNVQDSLVWCSQLQTQPLNHRVLTHSQNDEN